MIQINPGKLEGVVTAPPSKSFSIRALAADYLAGVGSVLHNLSDCEDVLTAQRAFSKMAAEGLRGEGLKGERLRGEGLKGERLRGEGLMGEGLMGEGLRGEGSRGEGLRGEGLRGERLTGEGLEGEWVGSALVDSGVEVDCGESALTLHLMAAVAAIGSRTVALTAQGTLRKRPLTSLVNVLRAFGARCSSPELGINDMPELGISDMPELGISDMPEFDFCGTSEKRFPLQVSGPLCAGNVEVDGRLGSQAVSGLLMVLPLLEGDSEICLHHPVSLPYIDLTLEVMRRFGVTIEVQSDMQVGQCRYLISGGQSYRPSEVTIPGDWSAAAVLMAMAAVSSAKYGGRKCVVMGVGATDAAAPDSIIIEVLRTAGVTCSPIAGGGWEIYVSGDLKPFVFDLTHSPDLAPPLAAMAASIQGVSMLKGAARLRSKESSRGEALQQVFKQLSVQIDLMEDELIVHGKGYYAHDNQSEALHSHHDHRIAMAISVAAVGAAAPIRLTGASCVAKTYPRFWEDVSSLGLQIENIVNFVP